MIAERELRREAAEAWRAEVRRLALPPVNACVVLVLGVAIGALALAGVGARVATLFDGAGHATVLALGVALAIANVAAPMLIGRRRIRRAHDSARRARASHPSRCPRCDAPLLARGEDEAGRRECGACDGALLEAEGLVIAFTTDASWRRRRWAGQARARLGSARGEWALSPMLWIPASAASLGVLWAAAASLGGAPLLEAPLALERQISLHPASSARADAADPVGPPTRPRAPLWTGTSVLARRGSHHEPAVIVRVDPPRAFVVYASGEAGWVRARELLAPELAEGDAVEVRDDRAFVRASLVSRIGPAVLVVREDGAREWTSFARLRVRSDARHRAGADLDREVPPEAWIEARVGSATRPGILVERARDNRRVRVVFDDGEARWIARGDVEEQRIGPGIPLRIDGVDGEVIVAARVGDALAVVDARGARRWTSLARVRR